MFYGIYTSKNECFKVLKEGKKHVFRSKQTIKICSTLYRKSAQYKINSKKYSKKVGALK